MLKSIIIFLIGASLSLYLNSTYGQATSLSLEALVGTLALILITIPMTVIGFVLIFYNIDFIIQNMDNKKNYFRTTYYYIKLLIGILFIICGLYIFIDSFIISSDELTSNIIMYALILGFGFIIYGFRLIKFSKNNLIGSTA